MSEKVVNLESILKFTWQDEEYVVEPAILTYQLRRKLEGKQNPKGSIDVDLVASINGAPPAEFSNAIRAIALGRAETFLMSVRFSFG